MRRIGPRSSWRNDLMYDKGVCDDSKWALVVSLFVFAVHEYERVSLDMSGIWTQCMIRAIDTCTPEIHQ